MPIRSYCLAAFIITIISAVNAFAATATPSPTPATRTVKFAWHASSSPEVVGYKIFWGTGSFNYQHALDVKNSLTASLTLSTTSKYYVAVNAYTMNRTSPFSNEVIVPVQSTSW